MRFGRASGRWGAALCIGGALLAAQTPPAREVAIRTRPYIPPSAILRANTNLVETGLTVRDSGGHALPGLRASDFEVLDDGAPREIVAFSEHTPPVVAPPSKTTPGVTPAAAPAASAPPRFVTFFFDDLHLP